MDFFNLYLRFVRRGETSRETAGFTRVEKYVQNVVALPDILTQYIRVTHTAPCRHPSPGTGLFLRPIGRRSTVIASR